jgi:hypothetical protein
MQRRSSFTSRDLALVAALTGFYLGYGYASGVALGHAIRELDLFFLISALFTIIVSLTGKPWSATLLGTVTGLILLGEPRAPPAVTVALIPNGIVFDIVLRARNHNLVNMSKVRLVIAGALGNLAMAISGLIIVQLGALATPIAMTIWLLALTTDPLVGAAGALFGTVVVERILGRVRSRATRLSREPVEPTAEIQVPF